YAEAAAGHASAPFCRQPDYMPGLLSPEKKVYEFDCGEIRTVFINPQILEMRDDKQVLGSACQQKAPNLVHHGGSAHYPSFSHAVRGLQIELLFFWIGTKHIVGRCTASTIASASCNRSPMRGGRPIFSRSETLSSFGAILANPGFAFKNVLDSVA